MRWRVFALVSLGINLVLAAVWMLGHRTANNTFGGLGEISDQTRTNLVVRRQFFSWREVESSDYPTYILNLRSIGCPEQTIRDIIIADVNALYSRKRATELLTSEQQWWRSEPDAAIILAANQKAAALEDERKALLAKLLGSNWETGDMMNLPRPSRQGILLDGPVLGVLSPETKQAVQDVSLRSEERMNEYLDEVRKDGDNPDPAELAKLRQQTREELQRILSPPQLEEFLLRYSQNANDLRTFFGQIQYFNPSPDEFRNVFRATDTIDAQIAALEGSTDPNSVAQLKVLMDQRQLLIKQALGSKRYEEYQLLQDPIYRDAVATAQQAGTPEAARTIYEINLATATEQARINGDTNLTAQQKTIQLKQAELEQLKANTVASGQDLPPDSQTAQPQSPAKRTHVVRPGDSAAVVALLYGLPVGALRAANPNVNFSKLKPGDSLTIPSTSP
jgi:LysM repeat protein